MTENLFKECPHRVLVLFLGGQFQQFHNLVTISQMCQISFHVSPPDLCFHHGKMRESRTGINPSKVVRFCYRAPQGRPLVLLLRKRVEHARHRGSLLLVPSSVDFDPSTQCLKCGGWSPHSEWYAQ